jgi:hypothetical protein
VFASTFSGESCTFGQDSTPDGWSSQFTRHPDLTGQNAVFFVPSFFIDPQTFNQYGDVMDGDFNVSFFLSTIIILVCIHLMIVNLVEFRLADPTHHSLRFFPR